jgi:hypothetical protein
MDMNRRWKWGLFVIVAPIALLLFLFIGGEVVRQLWNWLLPALFGVPQITFWQAWGLLVLCRVLFGGFGMHRRGYTRRGWHWDDMTPEERERVRQRRRERWCGDAPAAEIKGHEA